MNGRNAGKKGVIIKSNYENSKDKRFPHCLVVGISKNLRKVTKKSLKKTEDLVKDLEKKLNSGNENVVERLNRMKRLGIFIKTYNMSHLLSTRYKVEEDFGILGNIEKLDNIEGDLKTKQNLLSQKEQERKEENQKEIEELKKQVGGLKDQYKNTLREVKNSIGGELYNRFMRGFVRTRDNVEENEKISHSEFLFKKLRF